MKTVKKPHNQLFFHLQSNIKLLSSDEQNIFWTSINNS